MKKKVLVIVLCMACVTAFAQKRKKKPANNKPATTTQSAVASRQSAVDTTKKQVAAAPSKPFDRPLDGYYKKTNIQSAKILPYPNLRESDVAYQKRVWREIDVREKMNQYLASPKLRLIDILMDAIAAGELTAYDPNTTAKDDPGGDKFSKPLTPVQAKAKMADSVLVDKFDKNTGEKIGSTMQAGEFNADSIVKFRIKEDWIFDRQRSVFEPRIVGIAPMIRIKAAGVNLDYQP
ncbi:MAG: gliding motility protein GldN, partial [Mucilaginibacter sp.]